MSGRLVRLELRNMFAGVAVPAGFLAILLAGLYGLYSGHSAIDRQRAVLEESPDLYQEHQDYVLALAPDEAPAGDLLFYTFLHTHHEPSDWARFSLGGRDVQPYNLKVRLLTLEGQLYDSELTNPMALFSGNFDAAFVLIALFPLLIIAVTYGLVSEEEDSGTWNLVVAQSSSAFQVLLLKLGVRVFSVLLLALVVVVVAGLSFGAPFRDVALTSAVVSAYLLLWFAACLVVVSLRRSSQFNAITLLGIWLVWTVVGPALANVVVATALPVPEALEVTVLQRQGYHGSWDRPQQEVMENFYRSYPEYADYPIPDDRYSNGWYYAMNQMGDDEASALASSYRAVLAERQRLTDRIAPLFPPVLAQRALNRIARTDLESHLRYLDSVRSYHAELKTFFFPIVFEGDPKEAVDWSRVPRHWYADEDLPSSLAGAGRALWILAGSLFLTGVLLLRSRAAVA